MKYFVYLLQVGLPLEFDTLDRSLIAYVIRELLSGKIDIIKSWEMITPEGFEIVFVIEALEEKEVQLVDELSLIFKIFKVETKLIKTIMDETQLKTIEDIFNRKNKNTIN